MPLSHTSLVKYTKKETGSALEGDEALELTMANYGRDECGECCDDRQRRERAVKLDGRCVCTPAFRACGGRLNVGRWPMPMPATLTSSARS